MRLACAGGVALVREGGGVVGYVCGYGLWLGVWAMAWGFGLWLVVWAMAWGYGLWLMRGACVG